jgi:hypothetical protein
MMAEGIEIGRADRNLYALRQKGGQNIAGQKSTERDKKKQDRERWDKKK